MRSFSYGACLDREMASAAPQDHARKVGCHRAGSDDLGASDLNLTHDLGVRRVTVISGDGLGCRRRDFCKNRGVC